MEFHDWPFLIFFPIVYFVYLLLRKTRLWLHWLLLASYFFYGWWNPLYLILVAYSTALDYFCVDRMRKSLRRKTWLTISLVNNLAVLGFFKYAGFIAESLTALLSQFELGYRVTAPTGILLPVGISFFTFQSMSYTIDFYRGRLDHEPSFVRFATFVSFFPQLVAGPIERAEKLLPQLRHPPQITSSHVVDGLSLFITGLTKKVALADYLALYSDPIFANPANPNTTPAQLACGVFAFAWQIYFDFSGYTDMARGIARTMGFDLMLNFRHPYLATSMKDFWSRWHISLSTWFRDYLYIPLGGSRGGAMMTARNLFLTMLISGLWHGAAWTYLIWGAMHGLAYVVLRPVEATEWYQLKVPRLAKRVGVFLFVCVTWIFFRAASVRDALLILRRLTFESWNLSLDAIETPPLLIMMVITVWCYQWLVDDAGASWSLPNWVATALCILMLCYVSLAIGRVDQPFIYFQF